MYITSMTVYHIYICDYSLLAYTATLISHLAS